MREGPQSRTPSTDSDTGQPPRWGEGQETSRGCKAPSGALCRGDVTQMQDGSLCWGAVTGIGDSVSHSVGTCLLCGQQVLGAAL